MEEAILRQIQEEGLLDGIDLDIIRVDQDQISERIAEAYRTRQRKFPTSFWRRAAPSALSVIQCHLFRL
jgi:hypothetical protein